VERVESVEGGEGGGRYQVQYLKGGAEYNEHVTVGEVSLYLPVETLGQVLPEKSDVLRCMVYGVYGVRCTVGTVYSVRCVWCMVYRVYGVWCVWCLVCTVCGVWYG
jgi:hypothetical protein